MKHSETINKFKRAIENLEKDEIEILKISDFNTLGMSRKSWDALLFKEGVSDKQMIRQLVDTELEKSIFFNELMQHCILCN